MLATWATECANTQLAANVLKVPHDSVSPTVEAVDANSQVVTRAPETRTFVLPMVVESDVNLTDVVSPPWVVPAFVPPTAVVVDVRLLAATSLLNLLLNFVSSTVVERNASLLVVKRSPVVVPNSVPRMVAVSDASWKAVRVSLLESRNSAVRMAVGITLDLARETVTKARLHQWEDAWECSLREQGKMHTYRE